MPLEAQLPTPPGARAVEDALRTRIEGEVDFGIGARALYATDASNYRQVPIGVVLPRTTADVVETVRICREHGVPILPRGAGTSLAGQGCNAAVVLDMSRHLRSVLAVDPDRKTARVQPGVVLDDLQRAAKPFGLMYGPVPATHAWCTVGGMIGNNSCGVLSLAGGLTADVVETLEILTSAGCRMTVGATPEPELEAHSSQAGRHGEIYRRLRELRDRHASEIRTRRGGRRRRGFRHASPSQLPSLLLLFFGIT
jgi:FAD/FMN-containing dehydrogenase